MLLCSISSTPTIEPPSGVPSDLSMDRREAIQLGPICLDGGYQLAKIFRAKVGIVSAGTHLAPMTGSGVDLRLRHALSSMNRMP